MVIDTRYGSVYYFNTEEELVEQGYKDYCFYEPCYYVEGDDDEIGEISLVKDIVGELAQKVSKLNDEMNEVIDLRVELMGCINSHDTSNYN